MYFNDIGPTCIRIVLWRRNFCKPGPERWWAKLDSRNGQGFYSWFYFVDFPGLAKMEMRLCRELFEIWFLLVLRFEFVNWKCQMPRAQFCLAVSNRKLSGTGNRSANVVNMKLHFQLEQFNQPGCTGWAIHRRLKTESDCHPQSWSHWSSKRRKAINGEPSRYLVKGGKLSLNPVKEIDCNVARSLFIRLMKNGKNQKGFIRWHDFAWGMKSWHAMKFDSMIPVFVMVIFGLRYSFSTWTNCVLFHSLRPRVAKSADLFRFLTLRAVGAHISIG
jgi:hypothetical protein